jgi:hypothetical protein
VNQVKTQTNEKLQVYARVTGLLYLTTIVAGMLAQMFISGNIIVQGNAQATAANILNNREMFQWGFTIYLVEMVSQVAMIGVFYTVLKPVSKSVALLALLFGLVGCTIKTLSRLFYVAPLLVLGDIPYLSVFNVEQRHALALLLLNVNDVAAAMALAFFGFSTFSNGYLIFRSNFLPRFLGVLSLLSGFAWMSFMYPPLGYRLFPYILLIGITGSTALILWLFFKGIDAEQWNRRALESA